VFLEDDSLTVSSEIGVPFLSVTKPEILPLLCAKTALKMINKAKKPKSACFLVKTLTFG
jgi:hypothetical protein